MGRQYPLPPCCAGLRGIHRSLGGVIEPAIAILHSPLSALGNEFRLEPSKPAGFVKV